MKRLLLALFAAVMLTPSEAQTVVPASEGVATQSAAPMLMFGYISYQGVLTSMPEYTVAQENIKRLKAKYEEEAQRVEKDFNAKYESFLEGQRDFPKSILEATDGAAGTHDQEHCFQGREQTPLGDGRARCYVPTV